MLSRWRSLPTMRGPVGMYLGGAHRKPPNRLSNPTSHLSENQAEAQRGKGICGGCPAGQRQFWDWSCVLRPLVQALGLPTVRAMKKESPTRSPPRLQTSHPLLPQILWDAWVGPHSASYRQSPHPCPASACLPLKWG